MSPPFQPTTQLKGAEPREGYTVEIFTYIPMAHQLHHFIIFVCGSDKLSLLLGRYLNRDLAAH